MVMGCIVYANENKKYFPPNKMSGRGAANAYDIRQWWTDDNYQAPTPYAVNPGASVGRAPNLQLGMLAESGFLPPGGLGKIMHCPTLDNHGNPGTAFGTGAGRYAGVGMDVINDYGVGASWFEDSSKAALRIIIGYHYRAASWETSGHPVMRMSNVGADHLMTVDMPDQRFTGPPVAPGIITQANEADLRMFTHPDGYGRSFADGHVGFYDDRDFDVAWQIYIRTFQWGDMSGDRPGTSGPPEYIYSNLLNRD